MDVFGGRCTHCGQTCKDVAAHSWQCAKRPRAKPEQTKQDRILVMRGEALRGREKPGASSGAAVTGTLPLETAASKLQLEAAPWATPQLPPTLRPDKAEVTHWGTRERTSANDPAFQKDRPSLGEEITSQPGKTGWGWRTLKRTKNRP